jgi:hypothetical protein
MNVYLAGGALALLLWPKKGKAGVFQGPDVDPSTGERAKYEGPDVDPYNGSALGTFADPDCDVRNVGGTYEVHCFPGRRFQP